MNNFYRNYFLHLVIYAVSLTTFTIIALALNDSVGNSVLQCLVLFGPIVFLLGENIWWRSHSVNGQKILLGNLLFFVAQVIINTFLVVIALAAVELIDSDSEFFDAPELIPFIVAFITAIPVILSAIFSTIFNVGWLVFKRK